MYKKLAAIAKSVVSGVFRLEILGFNDEMVILSKHNREGKDTFSKRSTTYAHPKWIIMWVGLFAFTANAANVENSSLTRCRQKLDLVRTGNEN